MAVNADEISAIGVWRKTVVCGKEGLMSQALAKAGVCEYALNIGGQGERVGNGA